MQARLEVAVAREREVIAQLRAQLNAQKEVTEVRVSKAEEETSRRCFDNFLADFRVEERHYTKETQSLFVTRKAMVLQERLFFRNIPLSNWVEHEMTLEESGDPSKLAQASSMFLPNGLPNGGGAAAAVAAAKEPAMPRLIRG